MASRHSAGIAAGCACAAGLYMAALTAAPVHDAVGPDVPLSFDAAHVTIAGTSNIHAYTASTTTARVTHAQVAGSLPDERFWNRIVEPGALEAFEMAIPAASLTSPKDGLDKNMHKALKVQDHPDITFRLIRLEAGDGTPGALRGIGVLRVAGVEREIAMTMVVQQNESTLAVRGEVDLLMTDFGITPPKAMLGMLRTDPKVTVRFETVLALSFT